MIIDPKRDRQSKYSETLARYLFWRFIIPMFCCLIGFTLLFIIMDTFDVLKDFLDSNAHFTDMLGYFMLQQPQKLVIVAPMAFLLSAMFCFSNLSKYNEITALKASGLSLFRNCRYIWITTVIAGLMMKYTMDSFIPYALIRVNHYDLKINDPEKLKDEKKLAAFRSKENHRDWIFGNFSIKGEKKNVMITQSRPNNTIEWELRAKSATYTEAGYWVFKNGTVSYFDEKGELLLRAPEPFEVKALEKVTENPSVIRNSLSSVDLLSTTDIKQILKNNKSLAESTIDACKSNIWQRIFFPFACYIAVLLAIPLSISSGRGGVYANLGVAVLTMLSYYGIFQLFYILAKKGFMMPEISMLIPTVLYITIGAIFFYKKR